MSAQVISGQSPGGSTSGRWRADPRHHVRSMTFGCPACRTRSFTLGIGSRSLSGLIKRSFTLAGHRTSVALEGEFWDALGWLAQSRGQSLSALIAAADAARGQDSQLASVLRVMALLTTDEYRRAR